MPEWKEEKVLVLVKAYPSPSKKYSETVCTAGITDSGKWIRLYPVTFRDLPFNKRYGKFQWIKVKVSPSSEKLKRPESYKLDLDSIALLDKIPSGKGWGERIKYLTPFLNKSMEEILDLKKTKNASLGMFKPKEIIEFKVEKVSENWNEKQKAKLAQAGLFNKNKTILEKIPYTFSYKFSCDDPRCRTHNMIIIDWEINQTYRSFKDTYKTEELALEMLKDKWYDYFFKKRESYFIVGTDSAYGRFMILGVVSPKRKDPQLELFTKPE